MESIKKDIWLNFLDVIDKDKFSVNHKKYFT